MPGAIARAGFKRHVRASKHTLDIVYPPKRLAAAGSVPTVVAPTTPLTGPRTTATVVPTATVAAKPSVTGIKCLWYDQTQDVTQQAGGKEERRFPISGWRQGTIAVAALWLDDVLLNVAVPNGKTLFTDCDAILHLGRRYHVLGFDTSGSGSELPYVGYLWLGSSDAQ